MQPLDVVIAARDPQSATDLAVSLTRHFRSVSVAGSMEEVRHAIPKLRARLAVVDLELASLSEVRALCLEFDSTAVVCTHRIPDEEMWASALAAGAIDCCQHGDVAGIVAAVRSFRQDPHPSAA